MDDRMWMIVAGVAAVLHGLFSKTFYERVPGFFGEERREIDGSIVPLLRVLTVIVGVGLIVAGIFFWHPAQ